MKNNSKVHYKMYKAGKRWLFAAIATTMITTGGFALNEVHADTVNISNDATIVKAQTETESKVDNETQTQDSTVTTTDAKTNTTDATSQPETTVAPVEEQKEATTDTQNNNEAPKAESSQATTDATPVQTSSADNLTADKVAANNQNMQLNTVTVNLAVSQPAPASDVSVDVGQDEPSSETNPYTLVRNIPYKVVIHNNSTDGEIIPVGTTFTLTVGTPTNGDIDKFVRNGSFNGDETLFDFVDNGTGNVSVTVKKELSPGDYNFIINFIAKDPGDDWDGKGNTKDPAIVTAPVSASLDYAGNVENVPITSGSTIYVKPFVLPTSAPIPGYSAGHYSGNSYPVNDPDYPDGDKGFVGGAEGDLTNIYVSDVKDTNGESYVVGQINFNPSVPEAEAEGISLGIKANMPIDPKSVYLYSQSISYGPWTDISNVDGLVWTRTEDGATVDFSQATYDGRPVNSYNLTLVFAMPVKSPKTELPEFDGYIQYYGYTNGIKNSTETTTVLHNPYVFQPVGINKTTPWFIGGDVTIYQNAQGEVTYPATTDVYAFDGTTGKLNSDWIMVTNWDGYTNVNPGVGSYTISYRITNIQGVSATFSRVITVKASEASVNGNDVTIYAGEPMPAASAFGVSATADDGSAVPADQISIDTSQVNPNVAGDYPVTISINNGEFKKEVKVHVLANQAKVTAHDVTIHTGDVVPTDPSAYGASAVGKDGTTPVAIASVDTSKVDNQKVGNYPVVITDADNVSTTVNVEVVANQASISGQDVTIYAGDPMPAESDFKASATDEDGKAIAVTIDTSKVNNQVAGTYPVTITAADGQTKEVSVIVLADQAKVIAHDVTIHTGDVVPTDPSAYGASAVGKDGTTPVAIASVDTSKVDNQHIGTYPVVITDADNVSTTVNVEVVANQASISGQNFTIYAGDPMPADSDFKASATDEDGKAIAVTIDTSKVKPDIVGTYPVTITAADGQTKEVSVIVLADQAKVTAHDVTIHTGDVVPTDPSAYGASAVGKDGTTPVAIASVDTSKVDNQTVGTYPVVITDADGVSTTVSVEVKASAVTPSTTTTTPAQPSVPVAKETQTVSASETPAETKTTKQTGLPKTGQDATASLMSIIGVILLSIFGFFGLGKFKKKN